MKIKNLEQCDIKNCFKCSDSKIVETSNDIIYASKLNANFDNKKKTIDSLNISIEMTKKKSSELFNLTENIKKNVDFSLLSRDDESIDDEIESLEIILSSEQEKYNKLFKKNKELKSKESKESEDDSELINEESYKYIKVKKRDNKLVNSFYNIKCQEIIKTIPKICSTAADYQTIIRQNLQIRNTYLEYSRIHNIISIIL